MRTRSILCSLLSSEELQQLEAVLKKIGKRAASLTEKKVTPGLDNPAHIESPLQRRLNALNKETR